MRIDFPFKTLSTRGALGVIGGNVMVCNGREYDCIILRGQGSGKPGPEAEVQEAACGMHTV